MDRKIEAMIDEVEQYWQTHMFDAISSQASYSEQPVDIYKFSRGDQALIPSTVADDRRFDKALDTLARRLPDADKEADAAWHDLDSMRTAIARKCEHVGYFVGILMGAKLMGATRLQLEQFGVALDKHLETSSDT